MSSQVLVTGGTGKLGSVVVRDLTRRGYACSAMSSRPLPGCVVGDLVTGLGLEAALEGKEIVIHCASNFNDHRNVDLRGTHNLLKAVDRRKISMIIYTSIVGVESIPLDYYESKLKAEQLLLASGIPCRVVRFTQFHDFVLWMLHDLERESTEPPRLPTGLLFQSIALEDVSDCIITNLEERSVGLVERGGPEILTLEWMAEVYQRHRGINKRVDWVEPHTEFHQAFTLGKNTTPNGLGWGMRWDEFVRKT